jgi:hypothetical protein
VADSDPQDPKPGRGATSALAFGTGIGIVVGTVVFAVTQNPIWIGIGLVFGAGIGAVVQANRQ